MKPVGENDRLSIFLVDQRIRWARRLWQLRNEFILGGWRERGRFIERAADKLRRAASGLASRVHPDPESRRAWLLGEKRLQLWLDGVGADPGSDTLVMIFSGTGQLKPQFGDRSARLALALRRRGIPVLLTYWRWDEREPFPTHPDRGLLQIPVPLATSRRAAIARHPLGGKNRILFAMFPFGPLSRSIHAFNTQGWVTVYDCMDDWEQFHRVGQARWYEQDAERYLAHNCDAVVASSRPLQEKMAVVTGREVPLLRNALDPAFVSAGNLGRLSPRDGEPVCGYFGHLTAAWFDWQCLESVAQSEPGWRFELIGHPEPRRDLPANVAYLGPMEPKAINIVAARWRAAFIPFRVGSLSAAVDPIKIYEYLALGLPTVTLTMPQIRNYPYVFQAPGPEEFRAALREAMSIPLDRARIDAFLAGNRWDDRVDRLLSLAREVMARADPLKALAPGREHP